MASAFKPDFSIRNHTNIKDLCIISTRGNGDCYFSSLYRMIIYYNLENEIIKYIPTIAPLLHQELKFIKEFKIQMCNYVDNPENSEFIQAIIDNHLVLLGVAANSSGAPLLDLGTYDMTGDNGPIVRSTTLVNFRRYFSIKNKKPPGPYATNIEVSICRHWLPTIINPQYDGSINAQTSQIEFNQLISLGLIDMNLLVFYRQGLHFEGLIMKEKLRQYKKIEIPQLHEYNLEIATDFFSKPLKNSEFNNWETVEKPEKDTFHSEIVYNYLMGENYKIAEAIKKDFYVSSLIESINKFGSTINKIKAAKIYIDNIDRLVKSKKTSEQILAFLISFTGTVDELPGKKKGGSLKIKKYKKLKSKLKKYHSNISSKKKSKK